MATEDFWNSLNAKVKETPYGEQVKMAAFLLRPALGLLSLLPFLGGGRQRDDRNPYPDVDPNDEIIKNPKYNPYISTINDKFIQNYPYIYKKSGKPVHMFEVARRGLRRQQAGADDPEYQAYKKWRAQQGANYTPPWAQQQQQQTPQQQPVQAPVQQPSYTSSDPDIWKQRDLQLNRPMQPVQGMQQQQQQPAYVPTDSDIQPKYPQMNRPMQPVQGMQQQQQPAYVPTDSDIQPKYPQMNRPLHPATHNYGAINMRNRDLTIFNPSANLSFEDYARSGALNM